MKQKQKTLFVTLIAVASIVAAGFFLKSQFSDATTGSSARPSTKVGLAGKKAAPTNPAEQTRPANRMRRAANQPSQNSLKTSPEVGVITVSAKPYQASVTGYGEVQPLFNLSLTAQISGQIQRLSEDFLAGRVIKKGEIIAQVDDTDYVQAVATAKATVKEAIVALEEERLQGVQAADEWRRSGLTGEPASELVLRAPQLAAANAKLEQAQAALKSAQRDLQYTQIVAPFDAVVVERHVQPGSFVQTGAAIATLYSTDTAQISVPLSAQQWQSLPGTDTLVENPWTATLTDSQQTASWKGSIHRVAQTLASDTRQRSAIITLDQPLKQASPLYFGTYVQATINGKTWPDAWRIPATAISQAQEVWYVDADNTLAKFSPTVLFQRGGFAYIRAVKSVAQRSAASSAPPGSEGLRIVIRPLSSYLPNMPVTPVEENINGN